MNDDKLHPLVDRFWNTALAVNKELDRLHAAYDAHYRLAGERLRRIEQHEAVMRQAQIALEHAQNWLDGDPPPAAYWDCVNAITALREALGDKND